MSTPISKLTKEDWQQILWSSATAQILVSRVMWPQFLEIDGHVYPLLPWDAADISKHESYLVKGRAQVGWSESDEAARKRLASRLGEVDLGVAFPMALYENDDVDGSLDELALILSRTWVCAAREQFAGRDFVVEVDNADDQLRGPVIRIREL